MKSKIKIFFLAIVAACSALCLTQTTFAGNPPKPAAKKQVFRINFKKYKNKGETESKIDSEKCENEGEDDKVETKSKINSKRYEDKSEDDKDEEDKGEENDGEEDKSEEDEGDDNRHRHHPIGPMSRPICPPVEPEETIEDQIKQMEDIGNETRFMRGPIFPPIEPKKPVEEPKKPVEEPEKTIENPELEILIQYLTQILKNLKNKAKQNQKNPELEISIRYLTQVLKNLKNKTKQNQEIEYKKLINNNFV